MHLVYTVGGQLATGDLDRNPYDAHPGSRQVA